jgi:hypothetical protein
MIWDKALCQLLRRTHEVSWGPKAVVLTLDDAVRSMSGMPRFPAC